MRGKPGGGARLERGVWNDLAKADFCSPSASLQTDYTRKGTHTIQLVFLLKYVLSFIKPAHPVGSYGKLHSSPTLGRSGGGIEHLRAGTDRLLGKCGCWDRAIPARASFLFPLSCATPATISPLPPCGFTGEGTAGLPTPPPLVPFPTWVAAAFWGFASSSTLSNGLGADTLGLRCN